MPQLAIGRDDVTSSRRRAIRLAAAIMTWTVKANRARPWQLGALLPSPATMATLMQGGADIRYISSARHEVINSTISPRLRSKR